MWTQTKLVLIAAVLLLVIDYFWIGKVMHQFYVDELGPLGRVENGGFTPRLGPAVLVYVLLAVGLVFFVQSWVGSWPQALGWGALLGFVVYGVYDMTNLAILQGYSVKMSAVDMAWGTFLSGVTSALLFVLRAWIE